MLPPATVVLAGNLVTTSYVFFLNLAGSQMGIIPLLNQRLGPFDVSAKQRAKAFAVQLKKGGVSVSQHRTWSRSRPPWSSRCYAR